MNRDRKEGLFSTSGTKTRDRIANSGEVYAVVAHIGEEGEGCDGGVEIQAIFTDRERADEMAESRKQFYYMTVQTVKLNEVPAWFRNLNVDK
jgi:hypothetical protein